MQLQSTVSWHLPEQFLGAKTHGMTIIRHGARPRLLVREDLRSAGLSEPSPSIKIWVVKVLRAKRLFAKYNYHILKRVSGIKNNLPPPPKEKDGVSPSRVGRGKSLR